VERRAEIDWLKGAAILGVFLIHARPLVGTSVSDLLINRAVQVFIVLFGVTSQLWWGAHERSSFAATARAWYRTRLPRLMVPVWGMLVIWWTVTCAYRTEPWCSPPTVLATVVGYMPWVGTGWFVTLIIQLVILFPLIVLGVARLGRATCLVVSFAVMVVSHLYAKEIVALGSWLLLASAPGTGFFAYYYLWIFSPARLFLVVAGMTIAHRRLGVTDVVLWSIVFAVGVAFDEHLADRSASYSLRAAMDVPLTIVLLVLIRGVRVLPPVADLLAWCGSASWGLYLGQLLVHTSFYALGSEPDRGAVPIRWAYVACLFVGAVGFVTIGEAVRARAGTLLTTR
jgi:peptidoglycan/LPS O-acetylase OafA/YrhL